jgi:hypothetical protein
MGFFGWHAMNTNTMAKESVLHEDHTKKKCLGHVTVKPTYTEPQTYIGQDFCNAQFKYTLYELFKNHICARISLNNCSRFNNEQTYIKTNLL